MRIPEACQKCTMHIITALHNSFNYEHNIQQKTDYTKDTPIVFKFITFNR